MQQSAHLSLSRVHMAYSWRIASSNWVWSQLEVSSDASNRFIWLSSPLHFAGPNILFLRHFVACKGRWFVLNRPKHCDFPWSSQRVGSIENLRLVVEEEHSFVDQPSLQPTAIMFKFINLQLNVHEDAERHLLLMPYSHCGLQCGFLHYEHGVSWLSLLASSWWGNKKRVQGGLPASTRRRQKSFFAVDP